MPIATVTITGTLADLEGNPRRGKVTIRPPSLLVDTDGNKILSAEGAVDVAGTDGAIELTVPASDDPGLVPTGFSYRLSILDDGVRTSFDVYLPAAAPTVELQALIAAALPAPVVGAGPPITADLDLNGHRIVNEADPIGPLDGANRQWVESVLPTQVVDATPLVKGIIALAGVLDGTADSPQFSAAVLALLGSFATQGYADGAVAVEVARALLAEAAKINRAGDTMAGALLLSAISPADPLEAVSKGWVELLVAGFRSHPRVAVVDPDDGPLAGLLTIDDHLLEEDERVLKVGQADPTEDGIWVAHALAWNRPADFADGTLQAPGASVFVEFGTDGASTGWQLLGDVDITVGADAQTWDQTFAVTDLAAGPGLVKVGRVMSADFGLGPAKVLSTAYADTVYARLDDGSPVDLREIVPGDYAPAGAKASGRRKCFAGTTSPDTVSGVVLNLWDAWDAPA